MSNEFEQIEKGKQDWEETVVRKVLQRFPERRTEFRTSSGIPIERAYSPLDVAEMEYARDLGFPGSPPYTRGVQPTMIAVRCALQRRPAMKDFRELKVWQKAHQLVLDLYRGTEAFPRKEQFGLTSQVRRAAVSIPGNIAEGCGRGGDAELSRFLQIAMGSASELEYYLVLAQDLEYLSQTHACAVHREVESQALMRISVPQSAISQFLWGLADR